MIKANNDLESTADPVDILLHIWKHGANGLHSESDLTEALTSLGMISLPTS